MGWVGELLSVVLYVELVESWRAKTQKTQCFPAQV